MSAGILIHKYRFVFIGIAIVLCLLLSTLLIPRPQVHASSTYVAPVDTTTRSYGDTNFVTSGLGNLSDTIGQRAKVAGTRLDYGLRTTGATVLGGSQTAARGVLGGVGFVAHGVGSSIAFTGRTVGSGVLFVARIPVHVFGMVSHTPVLGDAIKPAQEASAPIIDANTQKVIFDHQREVDQQKLNSLLAAQLVANQALGGSVVAGDPHHGGYPAKWDTPVRQDSLLDTWGMYNRECVSYTAWKVYQTFNSMPYWGGVGNANQWPGDARAAGIPTGSTPKVHAVAISMHGYYGHAMWVEAVNGNMIYVSQYNYDLAGHYSEMWVNGSGFTYIYFK